MEKVDITIVGAGVVGLAIAAELSNLAGKSILVIERNEKFGQEASSRNSEVIHAGLYYPPGSLKAKLCVEGKELLYQLCEKNNIPFKKCGKLIVAVNEEEIKSLEELKTKAENNGVHDLVFYDSARIKKMEPNINAISALYSPSTGILDTHSLMKFFELTAINNKVIFSYRTNLTGLEKEKDKWICRITDAAGNKTSFSTRILINCAGLESANIAKMAGLDYRLHYCKGEYFSVKSPKNKMVKMLVYPSPERDSISLGIHTVIDMSGSFKLGPNAYYVEKIDYNVDEKNLDSFYNDVHPYLPFIEKEDLSPDMAGIRPKLRGPGEGEKDFIIKAEKDPCEGLINLIGIESPGLTASPAIAKHVFKGVSLLTPFL